MTARITYQTAVGITADGQSDFIYGGCNQLRFHYEFIYRGQFERLR